MRYQAKIGDVASASTPAIRTLLAPHLADPERTPDAPAFLLAVFASWDCAVTDHPGAFAALLDRVRDIDGKVNLTMTALAYVARHGADLTDAPRVQHDKDLSHLIDVSTTTEHPLVVRSDEGKDIGVVDKSRLLKGIQGGE